MKFDGGIDWYRVSFTDLLGTIDLLNNQQSLDYFR